MNFSGKAGPAKVPILVPKIFTVGDSGNDDPPESTSLRDFLVLKRL